MKIPRFFWSGGGGLKDSLVEKATALGIIDKVIFYGSTATPEKLYSAFDVFVFPSLFEGLGLVVVEAAASGLNCLVSDRCPAEVNVAETIKFLPITDPKLWAEQITQLTSPRSTENAYLQQIKESGYDIKTAANTLLDFYEKCLNTVTTKN